MEGKIMDMLGIRISDTTDDVVNVRLHHLLEVIGPGYQYWEILCPDVVPKVKDEEEIASVKRIIASEGKHGVCFHGLRYLASMMHQEINFYAVGSAKQFSEVSNLDLRLLSEQSDIVIEMVDSSYWEVHCKDPEVISFLQRAFHDTEIINGGNHDAA